MIMEGYSIKFMHILVYDFLLIQENILVHCTFCLILSLGRILKVVNSRNQCPPEYGTASSLETLQARRRGGWRGSHEPPLKINNGGRKTFK